MTGRQAFLNGKWIPENQAVISVFDRGFTLGDAVYEAMRTFRHKPFKVKEHVDRLYMSLKIARIDCGMSPEEMTSTILEVAKRNVATLDETDDLMVYPYVTRGPGGHALRAGPATVVIYAKSIGWSEYSKFYEKGVHLVTPSIRRQPPQCWDAKIKTTSRFSHTLAEIEAGQVDPDAYCLLLDLDGNVAEHRSSNFCVVRNGVLEAPTSDQVLRGITGNAVFDLARELGIPTRERNIQLYDVYTADEAFLVSTSFCILPASRLNGAQIGNGSVPGPITRKLLDAFGKKVGLDIVQQAKQRTN